MCKSFLVKNLLYPFLDHLKFLHIRAFYLKQRFIDITELRVFFFFFAIIHPTCKHALRKESTIERSVDDLGLFDDQRRKSTRII